MGIRETVMTIAAAGVLLAVPVLAVPTPVQAVPQQGWATASVEHGYPAGSDEETVPVPSGTAHSDASATASPTDESQSVDIAARSKLRNKGLPSNKCLANRHPRVFMYTCGEHRDQRWTWNGKKQLVNLQSKKCLAMHSNGNVFTHSCNDNYTDQRWTRSSVRGGYRFQNLNHRGKCLAAHSDGKVLGWRCDSKYPDQVWY
ncbi:RICIN domain-containing protein [Saccharothrix obliqua]|uniref:RICIN domain-containing protein n=1 Tax=Saccharothrix obliqua TaxID=2861747 RepID=UPI001C605E38|nr:ricin-type beta-trefoil lectin domain protein [Saccharothrix obliqua]MBW4721576.1 RICIN domain-containing protein [Saccharothrix obliqua]